MTAKILITTIVIIVLIQLISLYKSFKEDKVIFLITPLNNNHLLLEYQISGLFFNLTIGKAIFPNKHYIEYLIEDTREDGYNVKIKFKYK